VKNNSIFVIFFLLLVLKVPYMPQVSTTLEDFEVEQVKEIAQRESRNISQVLAILVRSALKERERQRTKKKKAASVQDHSS
jgi:Na+-transporting methylmalonyl-CoA/oxaloacetate decarboxylase gamma subunit